MGWGSIVQVLQILGGKPWKSFSILFSTHSPSFFGLLLYFNWTQPPKLSWQDYLREKLLIKNFHVWKFLNSTIKCGRVFHSRLQIIFSPTFDSVGSLPYRFQYCSWVNITTFIPRCSEISLWCTLVWSIFIHYIRYLMGPFSHET